MQLDIHTMLLMNVIIGSLFTGALAITVRDRYLCPGSKHWFGSMIFITLGLFFLLIRNVIPMWLSVTSGNGFVALGYVYLWLGFRRYTNTFTPQDYRLTLIAPLLSLMLLIMLKIGYVPAIRSQVVSLVLAGLAAMSIKLALTNRKSNETGRVVFAIVLLIVVISFLFRAVTVRLLQGNSGFLETNLSSIFLMLVCCFYLIGIGCSVMLITSQWLQQKLFFNATCDALTGIYNRYALTDISETFILTSKLASKTWCLAMIDIDHFKAVNDNYGHPVGDVVLKLVATKIQQCVRNKDILARYGGEEFVVILSDCSLDDAKNWAERVRGVISKSPLTVGKLKINVTVSIGITETTPADESLDDMVNKADSALYNAKNTGRNKVSSYLEVVSLNSILV